jgi:predicted metal-dependent peptidase
MDNSQSETQLRHAKIDLMTKSVFLSTICLSLKHQFTEDISTAATNGLSIIYNPEFLEGLTAQERTGLLAHEVWHVAFNHLTRVGSRDKMIWNKAGDYVINYMLTEAGFTIPRGGLYAPKFSNMSTEEVYEIIKDESEDEHGGSDFEIDLLDPPPGMDPKDLGDKVTDMIIKAHLQSKMAGKDKGEIPSEIARAIDELINPKLPWYEILQRFMSDLVKDDYSWSKPNKRFFPDFYLPSQQSYTIGQVVVAIDTSGSVTQNELTEMLTEIEDIRDTFKPNKLTIIDCDAEIHNVYNIEKYDNILELEFHGNGGTDFQPVIEYCNEINPEVLIYFTDLYADDVTNTGEYPILWICTSDNTHVQPVGETIYLKPNG